MILYILKTQLVNFFLISLSPVILSLSKDEVFSQDNLRRIPLHFDRLSVTTERG